MKLKTTTTAAILSLGVMSAADAALSHWQLEVGTGTAAASSLFSTISAPQAFDVGSLIGARTFEFIVNAGHGGASSSLLGDKEIGGPRQALKFEQYNNTGNYGITTFGIADANSGVSPTLNTDIHVAFVFDGTDTTIYENGISVATLAGTSLTLTDTVGLGGVRDAGPTFGGDVLDGDIFGFASYDSALSGAEVLAHSNAFAAVPEPSSTALLGLGGLALILRRRK